MDLESAVLVRKVVKALVVGDLILDRYVEGVVERINPEAPVPVVHAKRERFSLGGAANTALNLNVLGCEVDLLGVVGEDADGTTLRNLCRQAEISDGGILTDLDRCTIKKTRVISRGVHIVRVDWEDSVPIGRGLEDRFASRAFKGSKGFDVVVLSDYAKGMLTKGLLSRIIEEGANRGVPVLVDPKGKDFERYAGAFLITPNRGEAEGWFKAPLAGEGEIRRALSAMKEKLRLRASVVTLGSEGMAWLDEEGRFGRFRAEAREVFDITGAGDTVIATLACFLGSGLPLEDALHLANTAAGISVGRVGAVTVSREEILERLAPSSRGTGLKVIERNAVGRWVEERRKRREKIVFTNGCFDVLHRGHVAYLRFCRDQGDALIVGLNSDRSVRAIKGPGRPLNREADRAEVLAALEAVDGVVIFDEDLPASIIREVDPDVLVKGEDWREKGVVGREFVESRGGKVVLAPLLKGFSTSRLIEKLERDQS